jgi:hypothetical protein
VAEEEGRRLVEEHVIAERRGMLGGRALETTEEGKLQRTVFVATCERCGRYPLDTHVVCFSCRARLCEDGPQSCSHRWNGVPYCRRCLMEVLPLSRNGYKILLCLEAGVDNAAEIHEITKISKEEVKASLSFLIERKLISSSGLFAFLSREITADGMQALSVYKNVYGNEEDAKDVQQQLAEEDEDGN